MAEVRIRMHLNIWHAFKYKKKPWSVLLIFTKKYAKITIFFYNFFGEIMLSFKMHTRLFQKINID